VCDASGIASAGVVEHYPDELPLDSYIQRAADRAQASASGVGAVVERDVSHAAPRGRRWEVLVSDGNRHVHVQVEAPDLGPSEAVLPEAIAEVVEREAQDGGLEGVRARAPIVVSRADLSP
jgi:hypothetical protein